MTPEEVEISRSTPAAQFPAAWSAAPVIPDAMLASRSGICRSMLFEVPDSLAPACGPGSASGSCWKHASGMTGALDTEKGAPECALSQFQQVACAASAL